MKAVVTGGGGFIGSYLTRRLVRDGWSVSVVDNLARGRVERLSDVLEEIEWQQADVRDVERWESACQDADVVFHLAAVNGTENFYNHPQLVLDVGLRGALAVVTAARKFNVPELVIASSAEVYQTPTKVPTDETAALTLPDSLNPRYSYAGSKIASELIAFNYHRDFFRRVQVFRPHNVYGPDMGWKHVIPQFIVRALRAINESPSGPIPFEIQGDGSETRAFCYVDDVVEGIVTMHAAGAHRSVYHIGNPEMVTIGGLVDELGRLLERTLTVVPGAEAAGGTRARCPDIAKMMAIGYLPRVNLAEGLSRTLEWYRAHQLFPDGSVLQELL